MRHSPNGDPAVRAARASSFGGRARAYADDRPDYPIEGVSWALEPVTARVSTPRVLDLGAGIGKLTEVLLRTPPAAAEIFAVEPHGRCTGSTSQTRCRR